MEKKRYIAPESRLIMMELHVMLGVDSDPADSTDAMTRRHEGSFEGAEEADDASGYWK